MVIWETFFFPTHSCLRNCYKDWSEGLLFTFYPLKCRNYFSYLVSTSAPACGSASTSPAGLYAMIEDSSKLPGPAMHPCGQLNRPPPNLRRAISEAPYRASLSTSWPLSEVLKLMHRTSSYQSIDQTKLHCSKKQEQTCLCVFRSG